MRMNKAPCRITIAQLLNKKHSLIFLLATQPEVSIVQRDLIRFKILL